MTNAPKTVGLVHNGFGGWRLWTADDADDPTVVPVPYILAAEHERLLAERDAEIARLAAILRAIADADAKAKQGRWTGLADCIGGDGVAYQSASLAAWLDMARRAALGDDNG